MTKPVILAVAPVAHDLPKGSKCGLNAHGVAQDVTACAGAGAAMVHLHVRDERGFLSEDLSVYDSTVRQIRENSDIVIQGSTGGASDLSREQRCVAIRHPLTEVASLNIGSVNFDDGVYINTIGDIRYWADRMKETAVIPEMEVFDLSMIGTAQKLLSEGRVAKLIMTLGIGFENALQATKHNVELMFREFRELPGAVIGLTQHDMKNFELFRYALENEADIVRVGFEDGCTLENGRTAASNLELVEDAVRIIRETGRELATPDYVRKLFGIQKKEQV